MGCLGAAGEAKRQIVEEETRRVARRCGIAVERAIPPVEAP